jgi:hypothetical protein
MCLELAGLHSTARPSPEPVTTFVPPSRWRILLFQQAWLHRMFWRDASFDYLIFIRCSGVILIAVLLLKCLSGSFPLC